MKKIEKEKKNPSTNNPIKLNDLLPRDNVTGGKSKNVFGIFTKKDRKERAH